MLLFAYIILKIFWNIRMMKQWNDLAYYKRLLESLKLGYVKLNKYSVRTWNALYFVFNRFE